MSSSTTHSEEHNPYLAHHFESMEQQEESSVLGMWLFLAQEIMFFGGLFLAYAVMRAQYFAAFETASRSLDVTIGGINTVVLLLSSFTAAMAVYYTQTGKKKQMISCLFLTFLLGLTFIAIKLIFEYIPKFEYGVFPGLNWGPEAGHYPGLAAFADQGNLQMFFYLYYVMTGMHALHMIIGFGILAVLIVMAFKDKFGPQYYMPIMLFGLYWHFVDIIWVFLFPLFYLVA